MLERFSNDSGSEINLRSNLKVKITLYSGYVLAAAVFFSKRIAQFVLGTSLPLTHVWKPFFSD